MEIAIYVGNDIVACHVWANVNVEHSTWIGKKQRGGLNFFLLLPHGLGNGVHLCSFESLGLWLSDPKRLKPCKNRWEILLLQLQIRVPFILTLYNQTHDDVHSTLLDGLASMLYNWRKPKEKGYVPRVTNHPQIVYFAQHQSLPRSHSRIGHPWQISTFCIPHYQFHPGCAHITFSEMNYNSVCPILRAFVILRVGPNNLATSKIARKTKSSRWTTCLLDKFVLLGLCRFLVVFSFCFNNQYHEP